MQFPCKKLSRPTSTGLTRYVCFIRGAKVSSNEWKDLVAFKYDSAYTNKIQGATERLAPGRRTTEGRVEAGGEQKDG